MVTTATHMADAVSYLIRVATDARLHNVARKLVSVRGSLMIIVSEADIDNGSSIGTNTVSQQAIHGRRKP